MIVRELGDGTALVIAQEAHADVAAQFAAHWGNREFSRLEPYQSMVFGAIYHDSGHREMEADLPIDVEKGLPYPFRGAPPAFRRRESDVANIDWIRGRDPYASLLVTMHHAGLRKRRYDTVAARLTGSEPRPGPATGEAPLGIDDAFTDLGGGAMIAELGLGDEAERSAFWHNYRTFQVFDLLSLHFCCDGYRGDQVQEVVLKAVPVAYGSDRLVDLHLTPTGPDSVRMDPYPFGEAPLRISAPARRMPANVGDDATAREAYHRAPRQEVAWTIEP